MKNLDLLDSWFNVKLSDHQKKKLESEFINTVDDHITLKDLKDIEETFKRIDTKNKLTMLKELDSKEKSRPTIVPITSSKYILVAASVLLILGFSWLFMNEDNNNSLYTEFHEPYSSLTNNRSMNSQESSLDQAYEYYLSGDYQLAEEHFAEVQNDTAQFYRALSLMEINEHQRSIDVMIGIQNISENYPIQFYKGLSYLKLNDIKAATKEFREVPKVQTYYFKRAAALLKKIQ